MYVLFFVNFGFEYSYKRKRAIMLCIIKPVSDDELVGDYGAAIVRLKFNLSSRRFVKQGAGLYRMCSVEFKILHKIGKRLSAVYNVLYYYDIEIGEVQTVKVKYYVYSSR